MKYKRSDKVVEAGDHRLQSVTEAKKGASPKSQMSRGNNASEKIV